MSEYDNPQSGVASLCHAQDLQGPERRQRFEAAQYSFEVILPRKKDYFSSAGQVMQNNEDCHTRCGCRDAAGAVDRFWLWKVFFRLLPQYLEVHRCLLRQKFQLPSLLIPTVRCAC